MSVDDSTVGNEEVVYLTKLRWMWGPDVTTLRRSLYIIIILQHVGKDNEMY